MKTFALLFAVACSSLALLDNSAEAATPRTAFQITNPATLKGLNPQPLPPRWRPTNPGTNIGINPQPLPPRVLMKF